MKKIFCDSCGQEIGGPEAPAPAWGMRLELPCHIAEGKSGYVRKNKEGHFVESSGRLVGFDLCDECWDRVARAAHEAIQKNREA